nr:response regulator [Desulfobacterales bacterium]
MKRILVVDDDPDILHIISEILSEAGYAVDTIQDGQGAIERLKVEFYDLVITDLNMPEVGGMEVLKFIV